MAERKISEPGQGSTAGANFSNTPSQSQSQRDTVRRVRASKLVLTDQWLQTHGVAAVEYYIYEGATLEDAYVDAKRELLSLIYKIKATYTPPTPTTATVGAPANVGRRSVNV